MAADATGTPARHLTAADGRHVRFAPDLGCTTSAADRRLRRVLGVIDGHIASTGLADEVLPPEPVPSLAALPDVDRLDLRAAGITSVVWATGHRRGYPWLRVPVLDDAGEIRQWRGITPAPGLYVLGQRFQHFRSSNFIDGVGRDAAFVADHLTRRAALHFFPPPVINASVIATPSPVHTPVAKPQGSGPIDPLG
jgi:putative flavoprotein involved in K+ transport